MTDQIVGTVLDLFVGEIVNSEGARSEDGRLNLPRGDEEGTGLSLRHLSVCVWDVVVRVRTGKIH